MNIKKLLSVIITSVIICGCGNNSVSQTNNGGDIQRTDNDNAIVARENTEKLYDIEDDFQIEEDKKTGVIYNDEPEDDIDVIAEDERDSEMEEQFSVSEIDDKLYNRIYGKSYKQDCTIPIEDLRYLKVMYVDFNQEEAQGEIICNKIIADKLIKIFRTLYEERYPIEKIRLVDEYDADDERSMADNNSSCFNFRFISYTTTVSNHGKGLAIDINPLYNPYVKEVDGRENIEPANAVDYVDRNRDFKYKIDENDLAYKLFTENGFSWGGAWKNSKDYQHFEYNGD